MSAAFRVLVADQIALDGLAPLGSDDRFELVVRPGLTGDDLAAAIADADAVLVRSATKITRASLARADRLKVIGRAGVGVDTIDVDAATERGIPVLTAPAGNTVSAAELTLALMLALARRVPAADASMRRGEWDRKSFTGTELFGKTLGLVGAGRIGGEVARRARAFGMLVIVFDPYLNAERARALDVQTGTLEEVLTRADVLSVHVPLTDATAKLIGAPQIARMKRGALLLNVARGGVVDESALQAALEGGHLGGAALDVYETEPLGADHPFRRMPNVVLTPHLGASTAEAQQNVAIEIAEAVRAALLEGDLSRAVNAPAIGSDEMRRLRPLMDLAHRLGILAAALAGGPLAAIEVRYAGSAPTGIRLLTASGVAGALSGSAGATVNLVNAMHFARGRGIRVEQSHAEQPAGGGELLEVRVTSDHASTNVAGTLIGEAHARIVRIDEFPVDLAPRGTLLALRNRDVPGVMGAVGTLLGTSGIQVAEYHQARNGDRDECLAIVSIDRAVDGGVLEALQALPDVRAAQQVRLDGVTG
jgi:D-3-phosphoglycerate dehydrogenase / 2-oxoglutarate reductase